MVKPSACANSSSPTKSTISGSHWYYAQSYFGSTAKANVEQMINKMLETYKQRLQDNSWLSESTKNEALKKTRSYNPKNWLSR